MNEGPREANVLNWARIEVRLSISPFAASHLALSFQESTLRALTIEMASGHRVNNKLTKHLTQQRQYFAWK